MANVCIVRHQGYIKSKMRLPYQHNFRTLKDYGNKNIDVSLTHFNTGIENNLKEGETYLTAFNRLRDNGEFQGQLKVQGEKEKQIKFLDEFLVYPPYEKITEMSLQEQETFFRKELLAIQKYFPDIIILSANVHRDEEFHSEDEEMKALFPEGKVTPHIVALKFTDIEYGKISIQRMEEKVLVFDGKKFKSAGVQIVEHLKKENDSEYRFISLTDVAKDIISKARELNPEGEFIFERNGERITARAVTYCLSKYCRDAGITYKSPHCTRRTTTSRLSTEGMPLDKIRYILGQVDERATLSYIYNPNTEQENLDIMNKALKKKDKKNTKK